MYSQQRHSRRVFKCVSKGILKKSPVRQVSDRTPWLSHWNVTSITFVFSATVMAAVPLVSVEAAAALLCLENSAIPVTDCANDTGTLTSFLNLRKTSTKSILKSPGDRWLVSLHVVDCASHSAVQVLFEWVSPLPCCVKSDRWFLFLVKTARGRTVPQGQRSYSQRQRLPKAYY